MFGMTRGEIKTIVGSFLVEPRLGCCGKLGTLNARRKDVSIVRVC